MGLVYKDIQAKSHANVSATFKGDNSHAIVEDFYRWVKTMEKDGVVCTVARSDQSMQDLVEAEIKKEEVKKK